MRRIELSHLSRIYFTWLNRTRDTKKENCRCGAIRKVQALEQKDSLLAGKERKFVTGREKSEEKHKQHENCSGDNFPNRIAENKILMGCSPCSLTISLPPFLFQNAVSVFIRLGFAKKRGAGIDQDSLHPTWQDYESDVKV